MSMHFSGNQYEQAYKPKLLRNWEVPKHYDYDKPKRRRGKTEIISNNRGHVLPGVPKSKADPWGNYIGTWHLPKKIDRKTADELSGLSKIHTCKEKEKLKEKQKLEKIKEEIQEVKVDETKPVETVEETKPKIDKPEDNQEAPFCPIHG